MFGQNLSLICAHCLLWLLAPLLFSGCMLSNQIMAHLSCDLFAMVLQTDRSLTILQAWIYFLKILIHRVLHFQMLHKQIACKDRLVWNKTFKTNSNYDKSRRKQLSSVEILVLLGQRRRYVGMFKYILKIFFDLLHII